MTSTSFSPEAPPSGPTPTKPKSPRPYVTGNRFAPVCLRKIKCCASGLEHSKFVQLLGKISIGNEKWRRPLLSIALLSSCLTMVLAILSCLGFERNASLVKSFAWTRGRFNITSQSPPMNMEIYFNVGLGAIIANTSNVPRWLTKAKENKLKLLNEVQTFDSQECKEGFLSETFNSSFCTQCYEASAGLLVPAIFAVVTCLPSIQTDIQRMFPVYDLNCQKFMAVFIAGMFGTISTLVTLYGYSAGCWRNFPDSGEHELKLQGETLKVQFNGEWFGGPGLALMIAATLLKAVNMICHLLVPTPKFCRTEEGENDLVLMVYNKESEKGSKDVEDEKSNLKNDTETEKESDDVDGDEKQSFKNATYQESNKSFENLNNQEHVDIDMNGAKTQTKETN